MKHSIKKTLKSTEIQVIRDRDVPTLLGLNHTQIGKLGENIVVRKMKDLSYEVIDRNYRKKYGEIDIVCQRHIKGSHMSGDTIQTELHFIEVKSVLNRGEGVHKNRFRPEDNVHRGKLVKMRRVVSVYLLEKGISNVQIYFCVATVVIDPSGHSSIKFLEKLPL